MNSLTQRPRWPVAALVLSVGVGCTAILLLAPGGTADEPNPKVLSAEEKKRADEWYRQLTPEQKERAKEAIRLRTEADRNRALGLLTDAIALAEEAVGILEELFGKEHEILVHALPQLAELQEQHGDFTGARAMRRRLLALQTKLHGVGHWEVTDARLALAHIDALAKLSTAQRQQLTKADQLALQAKQLTKEHKLAEAVRITRQALDTRKTLLGEDHVAYATLLQQLAFLYRDQGADATAEPLYEQVVAIRKRIFGEHHPDFASSLSHLGIVCWHREKYARAEQLFRQALEIDRQTRGPTDASCATCLSNLAGVHEDQGDYTKAERYFREALEILRQSAGENSSLYATCLGNLAGLYSKCGDFTRAEPICRQAAAIVRSLSGEQSLAYARCLNRLVVLYHGQNDYARATPLARQALEIARQLRGTNHPSYAISLSNLAGLYSSQRDYTRAEPLMLECLKLTETLVGKHHSDYASRLWSLANMYQEKGEYERAEPLYCQAREIAEEALGPNHPGYAKYLNPLAQLAHRRGDYAQAELLHRQSLKIVQHTLGEKHPFYAYQTASLAACYTRQRKDREAEPLFRQALETIERRLRLAAEAQSDRQQLVMASKLRMYLDDYLTVAVRLELDPERTYAFVLRWKGAVFVRQQQRLQERDRPELVSLFDQWQAVCRRLATLALAQPAPAQQAKWRTELAKLTDEKEQLETDLARQSAPFRALKARERCTPADVQAALPRGTALVDFFEYTYRAPPAEGQTRTQREHRLAAFVLRPGQEIVQVDYGPVQRIATAIEQWRGALRRPATAAPPAAQLRQWLWDPLVPHLKDVKTVLVAPDGVLNNLPLAALPGAKPGTYLLEEQAIAVVPVPQLLPGLLAPRERAAEAPPSLLVLGDVDFGAETGQATATASSRSAVQSPTRAGTLPSFRRLPGTRAEILAVRDSFEQRFAGARSQVLRGEQATEAAFRQQAGQFRWLHLATHGFFAPPQVQSALAPPANPDEESASMFDREGISGFHPGLLSGLVLAGANRPARFNQDDGILTALEVAELDLRGAELAVLSACETGLGRVAGGEGVLGLQRAFQVAGAGSVVATLWQVPDNATSELMQHFYENLWQKKLTRLEALREAQKWMLREGRQRGLVLLDEENPPQRDASTPAYFWAGFVLSGDWR